MKNNQFKTTTAFSALAGLFVALLTPASVSAQQGDAGYINHAFMQNWSLQQGQSFLYSPVTRLDVVDPGKEEPVIEFVDKGVKAKILNGKVLTPNSDDKSEEQH